MNRNLVFIGIGGVLVIGVAVAINKSLVKDDPVIDLSKQRDPSITKYKSSNDSSALTKFAWKRGDVVVDNPSPFVIVYARATAMPDNPGGFAYQLSPSFVNKTKSTYDQITVVPVAVQEKTNKILFEGKPITINTFSNERWLVDGPLGPANQGDGDKFLVKAPADTWRSDTDFTLQVESVHRLYVPDKIEYPWELYQAMIEDPKLAERSIKENPKLVKLKAKGQITALLMAAASGNVDLVKLVIANGGDWQDKDDEGRDAMVYAASSDNVAMLDLVSSHVKPPDKPSELRPTPLGQATMNSLYQSIYWFVYHRLYVNQKDVKGYSPIMYAANWQNPTSMYLLLAGGADVHVYEAYGEDMYFMCHTDLSCIELVHTAGLDVHDENILNHMSPMQEAVYQHNFGAVFWYLDHGVKLEDKNSTGHDSWYWARQASNDGTDQYLRDVLADPAWKAKYEDWKKSYVEWMGKMQEWVKGAQTKK